jgi:hypothetical protein
MPASSALGSEGDGCGWNKRFGSISAKEEFPQGGVECDYIDTRKARALCWRAHSPML